MDSKTQLILPENAEVRVYALHGIRDFGEWQENLKSELSKRNLYCEFLRYDQFRLGRFLLQRLYADEIANTVAQDLRRLKGHGRLVVVCHSFGTYLIHKVLIENADIQVDDIIFCASIFKPERQLQALLRLGQIKGKVYNFCGTRDPWPVIAGIISTRYRPSGVIGIGAQNTENIYDAVGHGGFLKPEAWAKFHWYQIVAGHHGQSSNSPTARSWLVKLLLWIYNHKLLSSLVASVTAAMVMAVTLKAFEWTCYLRTCSYEAFQLIELGETPDRDHFIERKTVIYRFDHGRSIYQFVAKPLPGGPQPYLQDLLARGVRRPSQGQPSSDSRRPAEVAISLEVHSRIAIVLAEYRWAKSGGH